MRYVEALSLEVRANRLNRCGSVNRKPAGETVQSPVRMRSTSCFTVGTKPLE